MSDLSETLANLLKILGKLESDKKLEKQEDATILTQLFKAAGVNSFVSPYNEVIEEKSKIKHGVTIEEDSFPKLIELLTKILTDMEE